MSKTLAHWWLLLIAALGAGLCLYLGLVSNKDWFYGIIGAFLSVIIQAFVDIYPNYQNAKKEKSSIVEDEIERRYNRALKGQ